MNGNISKKRGFASEITNEHLDYIAQVIEPNLKESLNKKVDKITGKGLSANDYTDEDKEAVGQIPGKEDVSNKVTTITYGRPYTDEYPTAGAVQDYVSEQNSALYEACEHPHNKISSSMYGVSGATEGYYSVEGTRLFVDDVIKYKLSSVYKFVGTAYAQSNGVFLIPSVGDVVNCAKDMTIPGTKAFTDENNIAYAVAGNYTIWYQSLPNNLQIYPGATFTVTNASDSSQTVDCTVEYTYTSNQNFYIVVDVNLYDVFQTYAVKSILSNLSNNYLNVKAGDNIAYTKFGWDNLHSSVDLGSYYTKDETNAQIKEEIKPLQTEIKMISDKVFRDSPATWKDVQSIVRSGLARDYFDIGDKFTVEKTVDGVTTEFEFEIIGFDHDTPTDSNYTHSMTLQMVDVFKTMIAFNNGGAAWYIDEETYPNGLVAGTYCFALPADYEPDYGGGKTFNFTLTEDVPVGGQVHLKWGYKTQLSDSTISTYISAESSDVLETVSVSEGEAGEAMPDITQVTVTSNTNCIQRVRYGSNNWRNSSVRQWLNSDADANSWWKPQTVFDRPPEKNELSLPGFLNGMDSDFLDVVGEVTKTTLMSKPDGGILDTNTERFFLLSRPEVYGGKGAYNDGTVYERYGKGYSDLSAAGTAADTNRIKYRKIDTTAKFWWLRTASYTIGNGVALVYNTGAVYDTSAAHTQAIAAACVIW